MIHKPSQEQLAERFQRIPMELRKAISSAANADALFEIGKKHGLLMDKTGELAAETGLLMLGVTHPDEFVGNLAERLQVDRPAASKIADDINREIFAPVREHLRAQFGIASAASGEVMPPPMQPKQEPDMNREEKEKLDSRLRGNDKMVVSATLEDLEVELERALTEEKGIQPLSVVKESVPTQKPITQAKSGYKGADPYREQAGEDLPNMRGKAYVPTAQNQTKEQVPSNPGIAGRGVPPFLKGGRGGFSGSRPSAFGTKPTTNAQLSHPVKSSQIRPEGLATPSIPRSIFNTPLDENSPFTPLGEQKPTPLQPHANQQGISDTSKISSPLQVQGTDPYHEPAKPTGVLSPFRGFKMNNDQNEEKKDNQKESIM